MKHDTWLCACGAKCQSTSQEPAPICMDCDGVMVPAEVVSAATLAQLRAGRKQALRDAADIIRGSVPASREGYELGERIAAKLEQME